jgi:hypothetical protein
LHHVIRGEEGGILAYAQLVLEHGKDNVDRIAGHIPRVLVAYRESVFEPGWPDGLLCRGAARRPPKRASSQPDLHPLNKTLHVRALNGDASIGVLANLGDLHGLQGGEIAQGHARKSLLELHHPADQHILGCQTLERAVRVDTSDRHTAQ